MEVLGPLLQTCAQLYEVAKAVEANKAQCECLSVQVKAIEQAIRKVTLGPTHTEALMQLNIVLKDTVGFMSKFRTRGYLGRLWNYKSDPAKFGAFSDDLRQWSNTLQLGLAVSAPLPLSNDRKPSPSLRAQPSPHLTHATESNASTRARTSK